MIIGQFAEEVRKKLRDRMNNIADALAGGECQSFEAYKELAGQIAGLAYAESMLLETAAHVENTALEK